MFTKQLLLAAFIASGVTTAGAAHFDDRLRGDGHARASAPRIVHAPVPNAFHAPASRVSHRGDHRGYGVRDSRWHAVPYGPSPYRAVLDRNGWFLHWEYVNGNVPTHYRFAPPPAPSRFHRPVVDQNGWFLDWEDISGDTGTHPLNSGTRRLLDGD